jgi:hypothetical protein
LVEVVESAEAAGEGEAEAVEEDALGVVRFRDAAEADSAFGAAMHGAGGQHHVAAFDLGQFLQHGAGRVAQSVDGV